MVANVRSPNQEEVERQSISRLAFAAEKQFKRKYNNVYKF